MLKKIALKAFVLFFALLVVSMVYWPGLQGAFMLDDMSSLPTLYGDMENCGWWCGVLTGSTGPTGRPLSLISFAFQASQWPDAYYFKLVNLVLHLINTALLFFVFNHVLRLRGQKQSGFWIALIAALTWAVLPIQVSTVLYVIQRMVLLSSMFVLMGVLYYLTFRNHLVNPGKSFAKWFFCCFGLAIIGFLALVSKESGVLLLVYITVLELTLFNNSEQRSGVKVFRWVVLYIPLVFLFVYLAVPRLLDPEGAYIGRDFTLLERLLTQGRVLWDYLLNAFFPQASKLGLYHDDYKVSRSLTDPWSTLLAWLLFILLVIVALRFKDRMTVFSLALFWFLGGHLLESTIIPLELYFEHRNYLPLAMPVLAAVTGSCVVGINVIRSRSIKIGFALGGGCYLVLLGATSLAQAKLWGDEIRYGIVQAKEHPGSIRARALEVNAYSQAGLISESYDLALKMAKDFPNNAGLAVLSMDYHCVDPSYELSPSDSVAEKLKGAEFGYGAIKTISNYLTGYEDGFCNHVEPGYVLELVRALRSNPLYRRKQPLLIGYEARLLGLMGNYREAVSVLEERPIRDEDWVIYIRYLALTGETAKGIEKANDALEALAHKPYYEVYRSEVLRLRKVLISDMGGAKGN